MSIQHCCVNKTQAMITLHNNKPLRFHDYFKSTFYIPLLFGYSYLPFQISRYRFVRIIFVIYALTLSIGSSFLVLSYVKIIYCSPYVFTTVEYVTTVILLFFTNVHNRKQFFNDLEVIDQQLHVAASYYIRLKKVTFISVVFCLCTRILYSTALCCSFKIYCNESPFILFISGFVLIAIDMNQMPRLIVFHLIKYRMGLLRSRVESLFKIETISIIGSKDKRKYLLMYHEIYGTLLDTINTISRLVNPFFLLSLICSFPKIMFLLYNVIVLHKKGVQTFHLMILGLEALQWGLIACLPGLVFEITRAQVDKMKLTLLQFYKNCNDDSLRPVIKEFIEYIELRPCQYHMYRLIPVDNTLPVGLLHLCTTYLIVMVQFSHIFEDKEQSRNLL